MVKYLNENDDFNKIISSEKVLVDFYADWCGPCKMLGPVLENIDFIEVIKINVDLYPNIAQEYGVMSIPTLIVFENGKIINKTVGLQSLQDIKMMCEN